MKDGCKRLIFLSLILFFIFQGRILTQTSLVTIEGMITDDEGNILPGASLTIRNMNTGYKYHAYSRQDGRYIVSGIEPGTYEITVEITGFKTEIRQNLVFNVGARLTIDFRLSPTAVEEEITVVAQTPMVELTKSEVSGVVDRKKIEDLPLYGRDFAQLATLKAGVISRPSGEEPVTTSGQPRGSGEFLIDGVSNEGNLVNLIRSNIPADAIQEFRVLTNMFAAEYGNASGLVMHAITRSGTNEFRGRISGFLRDEAFDSVNYFVNHEGYKGRKLSKDEYEKEEFSEYRFGGFVGGPLIKDKFHFFFSYEGLRYETYNTVTSPLIPQETVPLTSTNNQYLLKLNYQLNEKNLFSFRFSRDWPFDKGLGPGGIYSADVALDIYYGDLSFQGNWTLFPSDNTLNELKLLYSYYDVRIDTKYPNSFSISRPSLFTGKFVNQPQRDWEKRYQIVDNFSIFLGKHSIKLGIDFSYIDAYGYIYNYNPGYVLFATDAPFDPANPATYPYLFIYTKGDPNFSYPVTNAGIFAQDSWKIHPRITLNYGLRWSYYKVESLHISNKKNFDPRIGVSIDPLGDGKTVIRAGFGKFTNNILTNEALLTDWFNQLRIQYVYNPGWPDPFKPNPFGTTIVLPAATEYIAKEGQIPPNTIQFTFGIQRQFFTDFSAGADFVYAKGRNLIRWYNLNHVIPGTGWQRPDPTKGNVWLTEDTGKSEYTGLLLSLQKRYSQGWALEISYTLSKALTDTEIEWSSPSNYDDLSLDYGPSNNDARHRLIVNGIVDIPFGFQLSGILTYRTALPYNIITGRDDNRDAINSDYPPGKKRNSGRGTDYFDINLRISKFVNISRFNFQVFAEMFNVTNRANFGGFVGNMQSSLFGQPTWAYDPRLIQLGIRFNF